MRYGCNTNCPFLIFCDVLLTSNRYQIADILQITCVNLSTKQHYITFFLTQIFIVLFLFSAIMSCYHQIDIKTSQSYRKLCAIIYHHQKTNAYAIKILIKYFSIFLCRNLARGSTIMISPDFTLTKNKLYRSFSE